MSSPCDRLTFRVFVCMFVCVFVCDQLSRFFRQNKFKGQESNPHLTDQSRVIDA